VIVVDGGKRVLEKGYGSANRATKQKNTPSTLAPPADSGSSLPRNEASS